MGRAKVDVELIEAKQDDERGGENQQGRGRDWEELQGIERDWEELHGRGDLQGREESSQLLLINRGTGPQVG